MILDLHLHSELSDDSRAPVEAYLKLLQRKRAERPLDGIVLTEHRQFDPGRDYRALEDRYGYQAYGGSDSHLVSFVGICATEFEAEIRSIEDLVRELKGGRYRPVDFRPRRSAA